MLKQRLSVIVSRYFKLCIKPNKKVLFAYSFMVEMNFKKEEEYIDIALRETFSI